MIVLHLSDLHLTTKEAARTAFSQLAEDLTHDAQVDRVDRVVVSGDFTQMARPEEFAACELFLQELRSEFGIAPERCLLVPGNHDLDWHVSEAAYRIVSRSALSPEDRARIAYEETGSYVEIIDDAGLYESRFAEYASFHRQVTGRSYPLSPAEQFEIDSSGPVTFVGLNSAARIDHHYHKRAGLLPEALNNALDLLRRSPETKDRPAVFVWHHPVEGDDEARIADDGVLSRLAVAGCFLVLHGHVHKPQYGQRRLDFGEHGRGIQFVGAGTFFSPDVTRGYPWNYNILEITNGAVTLRSRRREDAMGAWRPDARFTQHRGAAPVDTLPIPIPDRGAADAGTAEQRPVVEHTQRSATAHERRAGPKTDASVPVVELPEAERIEVGGPWVAVGVGGRVEVAELLHGDRLGIADRRSRRALPATELVPVAGAAALVGSTATELWIATLGLDGTAREPTTRVKLDREKWNLLSASCNHNVVTVVGNDEEGTVSLEVDPRGLAYGPSPLSRDASAAWTRVAGGWLRLDPRGQLTAAGPPHSLVASWPKTGWTAVDVASSPADGQMVAAGGRALEGEPFLHLARSVGGRCETIALLLDDPVERVCLARPVRVGQPLAGLAVQVGPEVLIWSWDDLCALNWSGPDDPRKAAGRGP